MTSGIHRTLATTVLFCSLFIPDLPAQIGAFDTVIANTRGKAWTTPVKIVSQNMSTCRLVKSLTRNTIGSANLGSNIYNGGAAYDAVRGGVWYSNGIDLSCVDPLTGAVLCHSVGLPVIPRVKLSPYSITVSGLAFHNGSNTLYMADGINGDIYRIQLGSTTNPRACIYKSAYASVRANMPSFHWLGGLAIDQVNDLLFVGSFHMTKGTRHIYVTKLSSWGGKLRNVTGKAPLCPRGTTPALGLQGLAFDSVKDILYVAVGNATSAFKYNQATSGITIIQCCKNPFTATEDAFAGLALMPERATSTGRSCFTRPCEGCLRTRLATQGDAALGNPHFALQLSGASSNANSALAAIGFGPCTTPGISLGFCGPLTISLNPGMTVLPVPIRTAGPCTGTSRIAIPIPANVSLAGIQVSAQMLLSCRAAGAVGHSLTNCLGFTITRN